VRVVLFVQLAAGVQLDADLEKRTRTKNTHQRNTEAASLFLGKSSLICPWGN
jgi:hypothetical protein